MGSAQWVADEDERHDTECERHHSETGTMDVEKFAKSTCKTSIHSIETSTNLSTDPKLPVGPSTLEAILLDPRNLSQIHKHQVLKANWFSLTI
jgi:hypothetical protein